MAALAELLAQRESASWRGHAVRRELSRLRASATQAQRLVRGHLARLNADRKRNDRDRHRRQMYFDWSATTVQRHWRGHWSRKNVHNYYSLKAYLAAIMEKTQQLRLELAEYSERQLREIAEREEAERHERLQKALSKKHHLLSTKACAGVFNPPWAELTGTKPSVSGTPVEDLLRDSSRRALREWGGGSSWDARSHMSGCSGSANNNTHNKCTRRDEVRRTIRKPTVRTSGPYDAEHQEQIRADAVSRQMRERVSEQPFRTAVKSRENSSEGEPRPLSVGAPFVEAWETERAESRNSAGKRLSTEPFYTAVHTTKLIEDAGTRLST
eukprot:jgi/Chlat1/8397/Chrsp80S07908